MKAKSMVQQKAKAARETLTVASDISPAFPCAVASDDGKMPNGNETDGDQMNTSQTGLLYGKRRCLRPKAEHILHDWLQKNFVVKNEGTLSIKEMHYAYLDMCSTTVSYGLERLHFQRVVNRMFPEGIALADDSPYNGVIRELKKKKVSSLKPKASLRFKMKDVIHDAIVDLGNPWKGLKMDTIANRIHARCAGLQPSFVKRAIIHEMREGHIECVRGIGACGLYRLPRTKEEERKIVEEEKLKKLKDRKMRAPRLKKLIEGWEKGEDEEPADEKVEPSDSKVENEENKVEQQEAVKKRKKKKTQKAGKKKREKIIREKPRLIEDTFPLAMTYNTEPKKASLTKIRKYLQQHYYGDGLNVKCLKKCLQSGCEHGYWIQTSGQTYQLIIEVFNPTDDEDMTGRIFNAIVACNEPKVCSTPLLKKYIIDYHPEFNVMERPFKLKKAIQRGIDKNIIFQLSGIGANGSFQLSSSFTPSPAVLQGKALDYEEFNDGPITGGREMEIEQFYDAYIPHRTKRRSRAIKDFELFGLSLPNHRYLTSSQKRSVSMKPQCHRKNKSNKHVTSKRQSSHVPAKRPRSKSADSSESEDESESQEQEEKRPPRKSKSRTPAAKARSKTANKSKIANKIGFSGKPSHNKKKMSKYDDEQSESETEVEYIPLKSNGRTAETQRASTPAAKDSDDEFEREAEVKYSPMESASCGGSAETQCASMPAAKDSDDEFESEAEVKYSPMESASCGGSSGTQRASTPAAKDSYDEFEREAEVKYSPMESASYRGTAEIQRASTPAAKDSDDEFEREAEVKYSLLESVYCGATSETQRASMPAAKDSDDEFESEAEVKYSLVESASCGGTAETQRVSTPAAKDSDDEFYSEVEVKYSVIDSASCRGTAEFQRTRAPTTKHSDDEFESEAEVKYSLIESSSCGGN